MAVLTDPVRYALAPRGILLRTARIACIVPLRRDFRKSVKQGSTGVALACDVPWGHSLATTLLTLMARCEHPIWRALKITTVVAVLASPPNAFPAISGYVPGGRFVFI